MVKLPCDHCMCNSCLKRMFRKSVKDNQMVPPRCCSTDHIPLKYVDHLFEADFKDQWNRKFQQQRSAQSRLYCPSRRCGEWIQPGSFYREDGRKVAKCEHCRTKVCVKCGGKSHTGRECPRDDEASMASEVDPDGPCQLCYKCGTMYEVKEDCDHITCRCGARSCSWCGAKWKQCDCLWNGQDHEEYKEKSADTPRNPFASREVPLRRSATMELRSKSTMRPRPRSYQDESLLRRMQPREEHNTKRRLRAFSRYQDPEDEGEEEDDDFLGGVGDITGIGNSAGHFMNESFRRRPDNLISPVAPAPPPPPPAPQPPPAFERSNSGTDYLTGVKKARGVRASSLERLAHRFNIDQRTSPRRRPSGPPTHPVSAYGPMPSLPTMHTMPSLSSMPMAPIPPPAVSLGNGPITRRHTMEDDTYGAQNSVSKSRTMRLAERLLPGRRHHSYIEEAAMHAPPARRKAQQLPPLRPEVPPRSSMMAGLTGPGRGMARVFEWRAHVAPGAPAEEDGDGMSETTVS